jgi:uncharacterized protein (TIGR00375 family)
MNISTMHEWGIKKGINLLGTGDFTHPIWFRELKINLDEKESGVYQLKNTNNKQINSGQVESRILPYFLLSTELSCIYSQGGRVRKIHLIVLAPNFETVERINRELTKRNFNLLSDGRPILGISARNLTELLLAINKEILIIPAHAWTPWFSLFGANSGFDTLEECFGEYSKYIYAIETGLSSDPAMNWRIEELDNRSIISFSDAHSPAKLGREVTIFELAKVSFGNLRKTLISPSSSDFIKSTLEFYPEEGKYHFTGHRNCKVIYSPNEARKKGIICPVCGKTLTVGVASRVEHIAKKEIELVTKEDEFGVRWIFLKARKRPSYVMMVPLLEILAEALSSTTASKKTVALYNSLINSFGGEFKVLLETEIGNIQKLAGGKVGEAIGRVRGGDIVVNPGYDGVFGEVSIWPKEDKKTNKEKQVPNQIVLF